MEKGRKGMASIPVSTYRTVKKRRQWWA